MGVCQLRSMLPGCSSPWQRTRASYPVEPASRSVEKTECGGLQEGFFIRIQPIVLWSGVRCALQEISLLLSLMRFLSDRPEKGLCSNTNPVQGFLFTYFGPYT